MGQLVKPEVFVIIILSLSLLGYSPSSFNHQFAGVISLPNVHNVSPQETAISHGSSTSQASSIDRLTNPPFQICQANMIAQIRNTSATLGSTSSATPNLDLVRVPYSATYLVNITLSYNHLQAALNALKTKEVTIQILSDLSSNDGNITSPQVTGKIIVTNTDNSKMGSEKIINFSIQGIRTECKFISLAQAVGSATGENVLSLVESANMKSAKTHDIDKISNEGKALMSGLDSLGLVSVINPPFATCPNGISTNQFFQQKPQHR